MTWCRPPAVSPFVAAFLLSGTAASAQTMPAPGVSATPPTAGGPLTFAASMFSGIESAPVGGSGVPHEQARVNLALGYQRPGRRSSFEVAAGSAFPYVSGIRETAFSYAANGRFSSVLGRRTHFEASQSISQRPLDLNGLSGYSQGPSGIARVGSALRTNDSLILERELRYDGAITLSRILGRRSSAALSFVHTGSSRVGVPAATSRILSARVERRLSSAAAFRLGYGFGSATFATAEADAGRRHDLDIGFDFARPLPFSGRTLFSAGTGSTLLTDGRTHRLRLVLSGSLSRDLGHAWSSRIAYSRPMQFVAGFRQPFLSDAIGWDVDGRLGRDWFVSLVSGIARGSVGLRSGGPGFGSYSALGRAYRQIGRQWRLEAEAFAMRFAFSGREVPENPLPLRLARRGVRAGITWSPLRHRR